MAFGLQFLDGVGEAYNQPVFSASDMENRPVYQYGGQQQYDEDENAYFVPAKSPRHSSCDGLLKAILLVGGGIVLGQALRKLFKD